ncbi:MAG: hypothetical protein WB817_15235 [Terriglobales bacterium]
MACSYVIDKEHRLVISTGVGFVTFDEMKAHQTRLFNDPDFNPEYNQLMDATAIERVALSRGAAEILTSRNIFSPNSRRALVANKPAIFGMGRLLMTYFDMTQGASQTNVFWELAPALKWLGLEGLAIHEKAESAKTGT